MISTMTTWIDEVQEKQKHAFLQRGFPTKKEEMWKYTDTSHLSSRDVLQKQALKSSSFYKETKQFIFCSLAYALEHHESLIKPYLSREWDAKRYPFAALNTACMNDGYFLFIPKNTVLTEPLHFIFSQMQNSTHARNILVMEENSQAILIEDYVACDQREFMNTFTQIHLKQNATLHFYKIQTESQRTTHLSNLIVEQKKESSFQSFCLDAGGAFVREDMHVLLQETGATCSLQGLYFLQYEKQHVDNHLYIDHLATQGQSEMVYKGILQKKSRAVFNGKVFVEKNAQKNTAQQANHNLLLSPDAEIDTKPELEIYADDVKCAHGATIGQLDADALFYLRARGIDEASARRMLMEAFVQDIFENIKHPTVLQMMQQRVKHETCEK